MYERKHSVACIGKGESTGGLGKQLETEGCSLCVVERSADLARILDSEKPGSLIVDLVGRKNCFKFLDDVRKVLDTVRERPRLIVISDRADQKIRLKAVQAGSDVFLATPVTPLLVLQHLFPASRRAGEGHRILLIHDAMSDRFAETVARLKHDGMLVKQLSNPAQAMLSMINFMPDVLIIGHLLPGCHGDEIGKMIHQLSDFEETPVIYLCNEDDKAFTPGDTFPCEVISDSTDYPCIVSLLDRLVVAGRNRSNRIQYLRDYDQLTGFLNREGFLGLLERGFRKGDVAAVIVLEIGNLNAHVHGLSPQMQNELVFEVSSLLSRSIPPALVNARIGDYGFAFLSVDRSRQELEHLGKTLCHDICSQIFDIGDGSVTVDCNLGIAVTDDPARDGLSLLSLAVQACHAAVKSGLDHVCTRVLAPTDGTLQSGEDRELAEYLQSAIDKNLFRLVYQPIASLRGNGVEKYEVLLRLYDGSAGIVPPSRFMPIAVQNGLMYSIDRWVIGSAMEVLKERGGNTSLFVKVASESIQAPGFSAWLERLFDVCGLPGNRLVFEVCDANIRAGFKQAAAFATHVRQLGCGISLQHNDIRKDIAPMLEHIPASYVKINKSTIDEIATSHELRLKLKSMIMVCEEHKARLITGFVEDAGDLQLLWKCGVHYIQGNFLQEPDEGLGFDFG